MRILYVEDSPTDAGLTRLALRKHAPHIRLEIVGTQREALALLDKEADYDLVLTDMRLPDGDGLAILAHIRGRSLPLAVVLITGHGDEETAVSVLKAGADDYVVKREGYLAQLPSALEEALRRYRAGAASRAHPLRVLYAEHNAADIDLTRRHMATHAPHIRLEVVNTGPEIQQRLPTPGRSVDYDILLMDNRLLGLSALEILKELRQVSKSDLPVVLVTGQGNEELAVEILKLGASDYVIKNPGYLFKLPFILENAYQKSQLARQNVALAESEAKYRALVEQIPAVVYLAALDDTGTTLYISPQIEALSGFSVEEWLTEPKLWLRQLHPEDRTRVLSERATTHATGSAFLSEYRLITREAHSVWLRDQAVIVRDSEGAPLFLQGLIVDITEKRRTEEERLLLMSAIEQIAEGILITDTDWIIRYVNPAFVSVSGYTREEIVGRHTRVLRSGRHEPSFYQNMGEVVRKGEAWRGRIHSKKKNGDIYEIEATVSPVRNMTDDIVHFIIAERDVTYEALLEKQLQQAQKMEAIGTLAGGIAHDFNNILSAIIGYTELSLVGPSLEHGTSDNLNQVLKAGYRARDLVKQILAFSRRSKQEMKPLLLKPIISEALRLLRASLPATIEIKTALEPESSVVLADPTQIHQVIMNLCTNASHAMREEGGILEVRVDDMHLSAQDLSHSPDLSSGTYRRLTVRDTGRGMDREVLDRIFDPFFTTKKPGEGTGMGLAVVHGIVRSHNGSITVQSEPGKGTSFNVFLPIHKANLQTKDVPFLPLPKGKERILFVDDEKPLAQLGSRMLEQLGYEAFVASNGTEALNLFKSKEESGMGFDLIITDQTMPNMTGIVLAREIMNLKPDVPVILCTGYSEVVTREKALSLGISEYLMKPLVFRDLAETVRRVLDKKAE